MKNVIFTEWDSHRRQIKEALQFGMIVSLYIMFWAICIIVVIVLEISWKIERRIKK